MTRARRVDSNQAEIVEVLRAIPGCVVWLTFRVGKGVPDILVGYHGRTVLIECKTADGELTEDERQFFDTWTGGPLAIVRSVDVALRVIGVKQP